jgi:hypothetical protein
VLLGQVEGDSDELPPVVLLDHVSPDVGGQIPPQRAVGRLLVGSPPARVVADLSPQEGQEDRRRGRGGLGSGGREELTQDPVEAAQVAVLAEVEEEDLVEVVERRLGDHLLDHLTLVGPCHLGQLALVERPHAGHGRGVLAQPGSERRQEGGWLIGRDELHGVRDRGAQIVFEPIQVMQEDLEQALATDHLLREAAPQVSVLDPVPAPDLRELLVGIDSECGGVNHDSPSEEAGSLRLSAVEEQKGGRHGKVLAQREDLSCSTALRSSRSESSPW